MTAHAILKVQEEALNSGDLCTGAPGEQRFFTAQSKLLQEDNSINRLVKVNDEKYAQAVESK